VVVAVGVGVFAGCEQVADPRLQRVELESVEQRREAVAEAGIERAGQAVEVGAHTRRDGLAGEVPDDRAHLPLRVERDAVVDASSVK
jgi:hypothetical protein